MELINGDQGDDGDLVIHQMNHQIYQATVTAIVIIHIHQVAVTILQVTVIRIPIDHHANLINCGT